MPDGFVSPVSQPLTAMREKRFSVAEFDAMGRAGVFDGPERVELWDGRVMMAPMPDGPHMAGERTLARLLMVALLTHNLLGSFEVQTGGGLPIGENNVRGPDLMILKAPIALDRRPLPEDVALVIEIAATSQADDLGEKREKYAFAGIAEYWVLDVAARVLHVFRDPAHGAWRSARQLAPGDQVSPLFAPELAFEVAALFG
jgi:Uma2 family endonuclease